MVSCTLPGLFSSGAVQRNSVDKAYLCHDDDFPSEYSQHLVWLRPWLLYRTSSNSCSNTFTWSISKTLKFVSNQLYSVYIYKLWTGYCHHSDVSYYWTSPQKIRNSINYLVNFNRPSITHLRLFYVQCSKLSQLFLFLKQIHSSSWETKLRS